MLPLWRIIPRTQNVLSKGIYSGVQATKPVVELPVHLFGQTSITNAQSLSANKDIVSIEGVQGEQEDFSVSEARRVLSLASEYQCQGPSVQGSQGTQENYSATCLTGSATQTYSKEDVHSSVLQGLGSHVSLHSCMKSNVPRPLRFDITTTGFGYGNSYCAMPGGGDRLLDKYLSGSRQACHQFRNFSTSSYNQVSQQGAQDLPFKEEEYLTDPNPQGVQGDNCVRFKLWMENCQRYNLPNCDEQLESLRSGRKTLAEVFMEQQEIIRLVAESYKAAQKQPQVMSSETNAQGQQDYFGYSFELSANDPCPQGLQGDDCANFKVWAHNCRAFGFGDCDKKADDIRGGRRTLHDVFEEQDEFIRKIVRDYQQKKSYSTSSKPEVGKTEDSDSFFPDSTRPSNELNVPLSQKDKLKRAVKDYGATVIVFHVGISLISLGGFYLAVSSGLDVVGILTKLGVGESILQSKLATGSTTFVVAYAVHKVFAPVRIATTLTCTPFIVRYLRKIGFLKPPKA